MCDRPLDRDGVTAVREPPLRGTRKFVIPRCAGSTNPHPLDQEGNKRAQASSDI